MLEVESELLGGPREILPDQWIVRIWVVNSGVQSMAPAGNTAGQKLPADRGRDVVMLAFLFFSLVNSMPDVVRVLERAGLELAEQLGHVR